MEKVYAIFFKLLMKYSEILYPEKNTKEGISSIFIKKFISLKSKSLRADFQQEKTKRFVFTKTFCTLWYSAKYFSLWNHLQKLLSDNDWRKKRRCFRLLAAGDPQDDAWSILFHFAPLILWCWANRFSNELLYEKEQFEDVKKQSQRNLTVKNFSIKISIRWIYVVKCAYGTRLERLATHLFHTIN